MPAKTMMGEETVKVVARLAIDSVPQDVRNYEVLAERTTTALENALNTVTKLEKPVKFCLYCIGVSFVLFGASHMIHAFRSTRRSNVD